MESAGTVLDHLVPSTGNLKDVVRKEFGGGAEPPKFNPRQYEVDEDAVGTYSGVGT